MWGWRVRRAWGSADGMTPLPASTRIEPCGEHRVISTRPSQSGPPEITIGRISHRGDVHQGPPVAGQMGRRGTQMTVTAVAARQLPMSRTAMSRPGDKAGERARRSRRGEEQRRHRLERRPVVRTDRRTPSRAPWRAMAAVHHFRSASALRPRLRWVQPPNREHERLPVFNPSGRPLLLALVRVWRDWAGGKDPVCFREVEPGPTTGQRLQPPYLAVSLRASSVFRPSAAATAAGS